MYDYLDEPIIDETKTIDNLFISGDPQIVKLDDIYVMFFFRSIKDGGAYNILHVPIDDSLVPKFETEPERMVGPDHF